jgi:Zn-dependent metalloprotease
MRLLHAGAGYVLLGLAATVAIASAQPADALIELKAGGARVFAASRGQGLTGPAGSPGEAVRQFLGSQGKSARALDSLVRGPESSSLTGGITHLRYTQQVNGLDVYGAYVKASVNSRGELVHLIEVLPEPPGQLVRSNVSPRGALDAALKELQPGRVFRFAELPAQGNVSAFQTDDGFFYRNPTATRMALPLSNGAMQEGWLVETWTKRDNQLHHTVVGNGGRVLEIEARTANEMYNVFREHPVVTYNGNTIGAAQTTVSGPGAGNTESPSGWVSSDGRTAGVQRQFRLSGNNVDAYLDADANNSPDSAGNQITSENFTAGAVLTDAPTTPTNRQVAIQNLFWASNVLHDQLYKHGFNEAAGNFQQNNFGKGGAGNDSVLAEAQDGSGTNNANFSTPADGSNPRMQMYLWDLTSPNRDGDVDTDIVFHEYGHGLTWRMIGSMSGCMSGAIGEGASDTLAILMNQDDVVGEYSYNNPVGIRRWPYTNYPRTYGQLTNEGVHAGGELFAAILWRAKALLNDDTKTWKYLVDGMNYIPAGPKYENMRDGLVQAAGGLTADGCKIYQAFAEFGVGQGASGSCSTRGFLFPTTTWTVTQSFSQPAACLSPFSDAAVTNIGVASSVATGTTNNVAVTVQNLGNQAISGSFTVSLTAIGGAVTTGSQPVSNLGAGASATLTFSWTAPGSPANVTLTASHDLTEVSQYQGNNTLTKAVTVSAPAAISLTAVARTVKNQKYADLTWSGATTGTVDVFKNGAFLKNTPNDGADSDGPQPKGLKTASYKVCDAGSTTACSNTVTVTF